jgi:hypothetical protein
MTRADQLRQARIDFEEACALGCTIAQLRRRRAADRRFLRQRARDDVSDHTETLMNGPQEAGERAFLRDDCPWMMRN